MMMQGKKKKLKTLSSFFYLQFQEEHRSIMDFIDEEQHKLIEQRG